MFLLCPFSNNYTLPPFVAKSYKLARLMSRTLRFWHLEVKQTELQYIKHWDRDQTVGEKMRITRVLLFAVVVLLFRMTHSKSVSEDFEAKGKRHIVL